MELLLITVCVVFGLLLFIILHKPCIIVARMLTRVTQETEVRAEIASQKRRKKLLKKLVKAANEQGVCITPDMLLDITENKTEEKEQC